ncbi:hypothetical protein DPMN_038712 [Dreissena polymorpha]|uniref:Uncharacterized protein n=1 Tax=Dreissena polymorpha TaxID=45954 RepID=A0A9D4RNH0_DREPO|nr:hypothetical protein DPMN_038712 [Dreissena polymorpha]
MRRLAGDSLSPTYSLSPTCDISESYLLSPTCDISESYLLSPTCDISESYLLSPTCDISESYLLSPTCDISESYLLSPTCDISESLSPTCDISSVKYGTTESPHTEAISYAGSNCCEEFDTEAAVIGPSIEICIPRFEKLLDRPPVLSDCAPCRQTPHITPQSHSPVITSYEKPTLSFEAMLLGDYPHVTIEDLIRAPFESTSAPGPELVKEENTRVLENGSALSGYLVDNDRENTITSLEPIASVVDQSPAAVDQKGTNCDNIIEKASSEAKCGGQDGQLAEMFVFLHKEA